jgi:hypothetical protein
MSRRLRGRQDGVVSNNSQQTPPNGIFRDFVAKRGENRRNQNWRCLLTLVGTAILGVQCK